MATVKMNILRIQCVMGLMLVGMSAAAIDTITLKPEAYVKGPRITLGDIADIGGDRADSLGEVEIVSAAPPGETRRVEKFLVQARLKTAGVAGDSFDLRGASSVSARTLHLELSHDVVEKNLRAYLEHEMPWKKEDAVVEVVVPPDDLVVPEGEIGFEWKPDPNFRFLGAGEVRGAVTVDGEVSKSFQCKVSVEAYEEVLVASSAIERGMPFSSRNVSLERRAVSTLRDGVFHQVAELVDFVARRPVNPGEPITPRLLLPRTIIKRNQLVTVETRAGGLQIETQARAGADGAVGDVIVCVNQNSNQTFQGVVRRDGVVVVE
jgi:flagella basal body P-ring formation protein FlgA